MVGVNGWLGRLPLAGGVCFRLLPSIGNNNNSNSSGGDNRHCQMRYAWLRQADTARAREPPNGGQHERATQQRSLSLASKR